MWYLGRGYPAQMSPARGSLGLFKGEGATCGWSRERGEVREVTGTSGYKPPSVKNWRV